MDGNKTFKDRAEAGQQLAKQLMQYQDDSNAIVLALPRGGVPVAYEVAKVLHLPLDVFLVRKLGVPFQKELAMGAIASGGTMFFNDDILSELNISQNDIDAVIAKETAELSRRENLYRSDHVFPDVSGKTIVLVDDGIATGATIHAAIVALKKMSPKKIIAAVPVAPLSTVNEMTALVDEFVCLNPATNFYGVGGFYEDFAQTTDDQVQSLLLKLR